MTAKSLFLAVRNISAAAVLVGLSAFRVWSMEPEQAAADKAEPGANLVQKALESELAGDNQQRQALLQDALHQSPGNEAAHWQLGDVRVQGAWQSAAEAARLARQNQRLAEYLRRRDAAGPSVEDQAGLARWCRKNHLDDQSRGHWQAVLKLQPDNAEAIQGLGLRAYGGMLLTQAEVQQITPQVRDVQKAMDRWQPLVIQWRAATERHEAGGPVAALEKARTSSDRVEMLALDKDLWRQVGAKRPERLYREMSLALIKALHDNPSPAASESLVRYAVFPDSKDVRDVAVRELKRRPKDHYVPLLISGLQSPMEVTSEYSVDPFGNLIMRHYVYREGAMADFSASFTFMHSTDTVLVPTGLNTQSGWQRAIELANRYRQLDVANSVRAAANDEAATRDATDRLNRAITQQNARITDVLRNVTDRDFGTDPISWANWWWLDYNEQYAGSPGYESSGGVSSKPTRGGDFSANEASVRQIPVISCFAPGTKVRTLMGPAPIEQIKVGDCVLAQDPDSGELAYKPVLAVTTRPPGRRIKIGVGAETITATPGHPFWVVGQGWRLTKELKPGERFHTLSGGASIESVEKIENAEAEGESAYNLIVADFSSYFVGEQGILVHDNTPRKPTAALVPGLAVVKHDVVETVAE